MKNLTFNTLVVIGIILLSTSCKKREGCTDPLALNYDAKAKTDINNCLYPNSSPVLNIEVPTETSIELTDEFLVQVSMTDDGLPEAIEINISNDEQGEYYSLRRGVDPSDPNFFVASLDLPLIDLVGSESHLTVACYDSEGGVDFEEFSFSFTDTEAPIIEFKDPPGDLTYGEYFSLIFTSTDRGGLDSVIFEQLIKPSWSSDYYTTNYFTWGAQTFDAQYAWSSTVTFWDEGDYIIRVTATDQNGLITTQEIKGKVTF